MQNPKMNCSILVNQTMRRISHEGIVAVYAMKNKRFSLLAALLGIRTTKGTASQAAKNPQNSEGIGQVPCVRTSVRGPKKTGEAQPSLYGLRQNPSYPRKCARHCSHALYQGTAFSRTVKD